MGHLAGASPLIISELLLEQLLLVYRTLPNSLSLFLWCALQLGQLSEMVVLVRGELAMNARIAVGALTVIDVHARDVMKKLIVEEVHTSQS